MAPVAVRGLARWDSAVRLDGDEVAEANVDLTDVKCYMRSNRIAGKSRPDGHEQLGEGPHDPVYQQPARVGGARIQPRELRERLR